jgi:hypothetical protein
MGGASDYSRLDSKYEEAYALQRHHEESIARLSSLTGELGLLQIQLPTQTLSIDEQEYLKLLIIARSIKSTLWTKLSRHHDEMRPLQESRRSGGRSLLGTYALLEWLFLNDLLRWFIGLGTKRYQNIKKGLDRRGNAVLSCVDSYNHTVHQLLSLSKPDWILSAAIPELIDRKSVFSTDPDSPIWNEVALGETWSRLWQNDSQAAPVPAWVREPNVRAGIRHVLLLDRIAEEHRRLQREEENMEQWYTDALYATSRTHLGVSDNFYVSGMPI